MDSYNMTLHESSQSNLPRRWLGALLTVALVCISPQARAGLIAEIEPNNSIAGAQNVDAFFTLDFDVNIGDASTNTSMAIPHVTISGTGDGTFDYYSFSVANDGDQGIFDIDFGAGGVGSMDTHLFLFTSLGVFVTSKDDGLTTEGADGSSSTDDTFFEHTFVSAGMYVIAVAESFSVLPLDVSGNPPDIGDTYTLQISIKNHATASGAAIPEPATVTMLGTGVVAALVSCWRRRRRSNSTTLLDMQNAS
jgi:hypothetical protein